MSRRPLKSRRLATRKKALRPGLVTHEMMYAAAQAGAGCGECTACCTLMGVSEIEKPVGVKCAHVCEAGCAIYAARPKSCAEFTCLYRQGDLIDQDKLPHVSLRPDCLGVMFWTGSEPLYGERIINVKETRPGAFVEQRAREAIMQISQLAIVCMHDHDQRKMIGPRERVVALLRNVSEGKSKNS